jgi:hypothetical protein
MRLPAWKLEYFEAMDNHGRGPDWIYRRVTMARAKYRVESQTDDTLFIRDVGQDSMTVTNDAEAVVRDLYRNGMLADRRLLYADSEGTIDELRHDGKGAFMGFAPGKKI